MGFPQVFVGLVTSSVVSMCILEKVYHRKMLGKEDAYPSRNDITSHLYKYVSDIVYYL